MQYVTCLREIPLMCGISLDNQSTMSMPLFIESVYTRNKTTSFLFKEGLKKCDLIN